MSLASYQTALSRDLKGGAPTGIEPVSRNLRRVPLLTHPDLLITFATVTFFVAVHHLVLR